jgi:hypothetical protein
LIKELITAGLPIVGALLVGLILYTVGQFVLKLVDPCIEFKKYIAEIGSDLTLYEEHPRAEDPPEKIFRKHASKLEWYYNSTLWYGYIGELLGMPAENKLREAYKALLDFSAAAEKITTNRSRRLSLELARQLTPKIEDLPSTAYTTTLPLSLQPLPIPVEFKEQLNRIESERISCDMEYQVLRNENSCWPDAIRKSLGIRRLNYGSPTVAPR